MTQKLLLFFARMYWKLNRPFVRVFAEALLGFGEGDLKVDGRKIVRKIDRFLREINPAVAIQFIATVAVLPLYEPKAYPKRALHRAWVKLWYYIKSFFGHTKFLFSSRKRRAQWIDEMYSRLVELAPTEQEDLVKTIVTLTLFKSTIGMAYMDEPRVWKGMGYRPFTERSYPPPSGKDLANPPRTESARLLHEKRMTARAAAEKPVPPGQRTYCVIGSGAGGAMAAYTLQEKEPNAKIILLEAGPLVTNEEFKTGFLETISSIYMNAAATLSKDQMFLFQQGFCVGGSTVVNNSVAITPEGFWWDSLKERWRCLGVELDYDDLHKQYDFLRQRLHVDRLPDEAITKGSRTMRDGFEKVVKSGYYKGLSGPSDIPSNSHDCIGCGRCNLGCQYDAKQSMMVTIIPDFVRKGGLLVPDAKVTQLCFRSDDFRSDDQETPTDGDDRVTAIKVEDSSGTTWIKADRFILAAGAYASTKLLWRSEFLGAVSGVRTVGKRFSVNAGSPVVGIFPERQDAFFGQQIGYAVDLPEERMMIETAFVVPGTLSMGLPVWGPAFQDRLKEVNYMMAATPVLATLAYGDIKRGLLGESGFVIDFSLVDEDWRRMQRGMEITARAMFEMGAKEIFIPRFDATSLKRSENIEDYFAGIGPSTFVTAASAHLQGGNVISSRRQHGVVDEKMKVYGVENLWICDASIIPAPITVNIALTTMALSRYAALRIADAA